MLLNFVIKFLVMKGAYWVGIFSAAVFIHSQIIMIGVYTGHTWDFPSGILQAYGIVVGAYGISATANKIGAMKYSNGHVSAPQEGA